MIKLNLVDQENSDIKYKISKFPDGQQSIIVEPLISDGIVIHSRLNSFQDLELIICANQALREFGNKNIHLYVPYFLGARSDRKFSQGSINYLKQVICPIINSQNFSKVRVMDPHSDVLEACLNNFTKVDNFKLVKYALTNIDNKNDAQSRVAIISPDAGALKKIYDVAKEFKIPNVVTASKVRNVITGEIVRTELPTMGLDGIEHIIIIDDICDGGRTFVELAKEIKKQTDKPIYLIITHGIFSAGYSELSKYFKYIYTTNSVKNIGDVEADSMGNLHPTNVKQLNIF